MSSAYDPFAVEQPLAADLTPEEMQKQVKWLYGLHVYGFALLGVGLLGWLAWRESKRSYALPRLTVPDSVLAPPRKRRSPAKKKPAAKKRK